ncbi:MAG: hypothetical protein LAO04_12285 [Acidobacteriia bacterium]|nr:hypothetical protein [Terriglobia bacterium]
MQDAVLEAGLQVQGNCLREHLLPFTERAASGSHVEIKAEPREKLPLLADGPGKFELILCL